MGDASLCPDGVVCGVFSLGPQSSEGKLGPRVRDQDWMMAEGAALLGLGTAEGTGQGAVVGVQVGGHHRGRSAWGLPAWHSMEDLAPHPRGGASGGSGLAYREPVSAQCLPRFALAFSSPIITNGLCDLQPPLPEPQFPSP